MIEAFATFLFVSAIALLVMLFQSFRRQQYRRTSQAASPCRDLKRQILNRLYGDKAAYDRLVANVRRAYPNRPERWILEKVLLDLERDRR